MNKWKKGESLRERRPPKPHKSRDPSYVETTSLKVRCAEKAVKRKSLSILPASNNVDKMSNMEPQRKTVRSSDTFNHHQRSLQVSADLWGKEKISRERQTELTHILSGEATTGK